METEREVQLVKYDTREEWLAARNHSIGASESAALFGLAPDSRESAYSLWAKKAGLIEPDIVDEEWLEWGQILEDPIAQRYAKRTGHQLWTPPTPWCVAVHPRLSFLTATVDRWIVQAKGRADRGDLEIKNVGAFNSDWREDGSAVVPLHVQAQVQHQLAVTGFSWAVVAALVGGNKLETFEVERNEEFIRELEAKAEEFWANVQRKEAPATDGKEATTRALKKLHPDDNGQTIDCDANDALIWESYERAKATEKQAKADVEAFGNHIKAKIGAATYAKFPDGRVISYRTASRGGYAVEPTKYRSLKFEKPKTITKGSK